jgi:hypothetical protein
MEYSTISHYRNSVVRLANRMAAKQTERKHNGAMHPGRSARVMLAAAMLGTCYLDFFRYKAGGFDDPHALEGRLRGLSPAPEQYRMGVYWVAQRVVASLHVAPTMVLALLDGAAGLVALLLLFGVLERTEIYARAERAAQWFGAAAFVLLATWFLGWVLWLQKPETLPATAFVAAMLWLWEPRAATDQIGGWKAAALLGLSVGLATFRADAACLLNAGVFVYAATRGERLGLPRPAAMLTAALGAITASGMQLWLMRVVYPSASYGRVKMWQLWPNLKHGSRWPPFLVFLLPLGWMVTQGVRRGFPKDAAGRAMLVGAGFYAALWLAIGKIDEVRIFLPFALALAPLTVQMAMERVERGG